MVSKNQTQVKQLGMHTRMCTYISQVDFCKKKKRKEKKEKNHFNEPKLEGT